MLLPARPWRVNYFACNSTDRNPALLSRRLQAPCILRKIQCCCKTADKDGICLGEETIDVELLTKEITSLSGPTLELEPHLVRLMLY